MAASPDVFKCSCTACGVHLEVQIELLDTAIQCPNCNAETPLTLPPDAPPTTEPEKLLFATILSAFQGPVRGQGVSFFYQLGLLLLTAAILILPLIYLAMVA